MANRLSVSAQLGVSTWLSEGFLFFVGFGNNKTKALSLTLQAFGFSFKMDSTRNLITGIAVLVESVASKVR